MGRFYFLWKYIRPWKSSLIFAFVGLTFVSLASLVYPWLLKLMVDHFSDGASSGIRVTSLSVLLLVVFSASAVVGYFQQVEMQSIGFKMRNAIREQFYEALLLKPMKFHRESQVGELSARATEDIGKLQQLFSSLVSPIFQNALFIGGCLVLMAMLNSTATLVVIALTAIPLPFVYRSSKQIRSRSSISQAAHAQANAQFEESLVGIREVKAFLRERLEAVRYGTRLGEALPAELQAAKLHVKTNQIVYFLFSSLLLSIFYFGSNRMFFPDWTLGGVIAFYFYAYTMAMAVLSVGRVYLTYQNMTGALDRIIQLMEPDDKIVDRSAILRPTNETGCSIEFREVTFGYTSGKNVLDRCSFVLDPGSWLLVTGASGSGKSTLASLLMGFYNADSGEILINGTPLERWNITELRSRIGYVGQDPFLIHATLRENIAFATRDFSEKQIQDAIELACLSEVIQKLPYGLETIIGERGFTLSGGQKARVAVARAIAFNPEILILDEANSMLEPDLETRLWKNLTAARPSRTTIILSHHSENIPKRYQSISLSPIHSVETRSHRLRTTENRGV